MDQISYRSGEMQHFIATRSFALGSTGLQINRGMDLHFDGTKVAVDGSEITMPQLRGAVRSGWLVLAETFDEAATQARPVAANIQVRHPTQGGNPFEGKVPMKKVAVVAETDEREVGNTTSHAAAAREANANYRHGQPVRHEPGATVGVQDGVPVRRLKTAAGERAKNARTVLTAESLGSELRKAENVQIEAGEGLSESDYLDRLPDAEREEYLAKKEAARLKYADASPVVKTVAKVKAAKTETREGITAKVKTGGGVETADPIDPGEKAVVTEHVEDGIVFKNTNGPKKKATAPPRSEEAAQPVMLRDGTAKARLKIARALCPDFPEDYDFSAPDRTKLAQIAEGLSNGEYEGREDILRALFAAESDDFKAKFLAAFPDVFGAALVLLCECSGVNPTSKHRFSHGAGRDKVASGALVYLVEELGDARLRATQLKQYVAKALELVEKSKARDHMFEVGSDLIHGIPDTLFKLDKALGAAAMAASRMDYEEIKQGLKPEKAEELERVLDDVRLHYLKRRSATMKSREAAHLLNRLAANAESTGRVPIGVVARLIARFEGGSRTASGEKNPALFFRQAAEYLQSTSEPDMSAIVASLREVLADAVVDAGAGEEFKKVNPDISDEAVEKIDEMHEKNKDVVKDKQAAYGDPYWMTAKYPGKDKDGKPFKKGEKVFYYPRTKTILTGPEAEKAAREFASAASDEDFYGYRAASMKTAYDVILSDTLEDVEKDLISIKRPLTEIVTSLDAIDAELTKQDKLKRPGAALSAAVSALDAAYGKADKALDALMKVISAGDEDEPMEKSAALDSLAEGLDDACWEGYEAYGFKPGEGGGKVPNCVPVKSASLDSVADEWKAARFEKGVPADPTENMSEEDAAEWKAMTEEHKDQFKSAADKNTKKQVSDLLVKTNAETKLDNGNEWKAEIDGFKLWVGAPSDSRSGRYDYDIRDSRNHSVAGKVRSFASLAKALADGIERLKESSAKTASFDPWEAMTEEHKDQFKSAASNRFRSKLADNHFVIENPDEPRLASVFTKMLAQVAKSMKGRVTEDTWGEGYMRYEDYTTSSYGDRNTYHFNEWKGEVTSEHAKIKFSLNMEPLDRKTNDPKKGFVYSFYPRTNTDSPEVEKILDQMQTVGVHKVGLSSVMQAVGKVPSLVDELASSIELVGIDYLKLTESVKRGVAEFKDKWELALSQNDLQGRVNFWGVDLSTGKSLSRRGGAGGEVVVDNYLGKPNAALLKKLVAAIANDISRKYDIEFVFDRAKTMGGDWRLAFKFQPHDKWGDFPMKAASTKVTPIRSGDSVEWGGERWLVTDTEGYPAKKLTLRKTVVVDPKKRFKDEAVTRRNVPADEVTEHFPMKTASFDPWKA
jgi:hypothetical protein